MSMLWIGGKKEIVPPEKITLEMLNNRFFKPGILHGTEDILYCVYLNDAKAGTPDDPDQFELHIISAQLIKDAASEVHGVFSTNVEAFWDILWERSESFGISNDGTGDFRSIVEEWPNSVEMTVEELLDWANSVTTKEVK